MMSTRTNMVLRHADPSMSKGPLFGLGDTVSDSKFLLFLGDVYISKCQLNDMWFPLAQHAATTKIVGCYHPSKRLLFIRPRVVLTYLLRKNLPCMIYVSVLASVNTHSSRIAVQHSLTFLGRIFKEICRWCILTS